MIDFDIECCPHCGTEINYVAYTCPTCGEELPEGALFCPQCGEDVDDDSLVCVECGNDITEEDIDNYNQLSDEEKIALRETYMQKVSEEEKEAEEFRKEEERKRKQEQDLLAVSKAKDEAIVNEITNYIKSQVPFDCELKVSVTLVLINLQAKIINTNYTLSAMIYQKDKATALPKFAQALIAIHKVADK